MPDPDPDPDPDLEISNFSSDAPFFYPVAHLRRLGVAHHEASSGALPGAPLVTHLLVAHHYWHLGAPPLYHLGVPLIYHKMRHCLLHK